MYKLWIKGSEGKSWAKSIHMEKERSQKGGSFLAQTIYGQRKRRGEGRGDGGRERDKESKGGYSVEGKLS